MYRQNKNIAKCTVAACCVPRSSATGSRIIFAVEFDWQDEWPEGASESIASYVMLNLRLQFSLRPTRIPREDPGFPFRSADVPRHVPSDSSASLFRARDATIADRCSLSERAEIFGQFRNRCKFQFAKRQYLPNRVEKGFLCTGILSAIDSRA